MKKIVSLIIVGLVVCLSVSVMGSEAKASFIDKNKKSDASCIVPFDDYVYCDYAVEITNIVDTPSGNLNYNYKWNGKREIYKGGDFVGNEYQYNGEFLGKYNMAQRWNINENSLILWEAKAEVQPDGIILYCTITAKATDKDIQFTKEVCKTEEP